MSLGRSVAIGVLTAALVFAPAAQAQKGKLGETAPWQIGPFVGVNFASLSLTNFSGVTSSSHTGFAIGGEVERTLNPSLFLRVGAFYSMRGSDLSGNGSTATVKLNYIEIPAVLGYRFAISGSQISPYVMAGGQFGIETGCTVDSNGSSVACSDPTALGGNVSGTDIGLTFGGGVGFKAGSGDIKVDIRYLVGFTNLISSVSTSSTMKNTGFTIAAGYMVPIGH
jgi:outer membrane protein with beta-barrel domain